MNCVECGATMQVDENGIANHLDEDGNIDYDLDADHVAFDHYDLEFTIEAQ